MPIKNAVLSQGLRTKQNSRRSKGTPRSSQKIRNKFFQTIGICSNHTTQHASVAVAERSVRDLRYMPRFSEQLQYNRDEERLQREQRRSYDAKLLSNTVPSTATQKKRVNFQESVVVAPIPMRSEYSGRIRSKLWSDDVEINENVDRNRVEFTAESRDWRRVCLEDDMYICGITGELIHPIHLQTSQYVFGTGKGFQQPSLSCER